MTWKCIVFILDYLFGLFFSGEASGKQIKQSQIEQSEIDRARDEDDEIRASKLNGSALVTLVNELSW